MKSKVRLHLIIIVANGLYAALFTFRFPGHADITAMKYQPMMRLRQNRSRNVLHKLLLRFKWCLGVPRQSDSGGNPEDMSVNRHRGIPESHRRHYIRRFPPDSRQFLKLVNVRRDHPAELRHQRPRHSDKILRLVVRI